MRRTSERTRWVREPPPRIFLSCNPSPSRTALSVEYKQHGDDAVTAPCFPVLFEAEEFWTGN